jgi:hypothetical protein
MFAPHLQPGSFMVCHDYNTETPEFGDHDIVEVEKLGLTRVCGNLCDRIGSASVVFHKP